MTTSTSAPVIDVDQHYYETEDAFTRHLPKGWEERTVRRAVVDGKVRFLVGGKINSTVNNPTFDPIVKAGAMEDFFRGNTKKKTLDECHADREPIPASFRDRDVRLKVMDEQGIQYAWMLPTLGMAYEEDLQYDPEAAAVAFHSFNEWILEDWGFAYQGRIFGTPYLAMGDIDAAVKEVEWALGNGARIFTVRPSGVYTKEGWKSPGNPVFDPIWARIHEAKAVVAPHVAETGSYGLDRYVQHGTNLIGKGAPPLEFVVGFERAIQSYLASLVCDKLFERFPGLRFASLENGSDFVRNLLKGLNRTNFLVPGYFSEDPVESFKQHVWISPFWEDDLVEVASLIGPDRMLFGSDWPHPEALTHPLDYYHETERLHDPKAERKIMYENAAFLTGLA